MNAPSEFRNHLSKSALSGQRGAGRSLVSDLEVGKAEAYVEMLTWVFGTTAETDAD